MEHRNQFPCFVLLRQSAGEQSAAKKAAEKRYQLGLLADVYGIPEEADKTDKTDVHQHDQNWTNWMSLGNSLTVVTSLAEREGLFGNVPCVYFDPPCGIKFNHPTVLRPSHLQPP
ncbi:MAG: hypothetical protein NT069_19325 [Planctomycetota bacterium]|nr:hypothetical protein [Planctomycetota bacterium]